MIGKLIDIMANIGYGILIAIVLDIILLVSIAALNDKCGLNFVSFIIAAIIAVPISLFMSQIIGVCTLSNTTNAVKNIVGSISPTLGQYVPSVSGYDIRRFIFFRIFWILMNLIIGGIGIWTTMSKKRKMNHTTFDDYNSNGSSLTDDWGL